MKKSLHLFTVLMAFCLISYSCSQEEDLNEKSQKLVEANQQLANILSEKYGIETINLEDGNFRFKYPDERILQVNNEGGEVILTGSRINNEIFKIRMADENKASSYQLEFLDENSRKTISKQRFISAVNSSSNIVNSGFKAAAPCDEHISNETFDECFKKEWDDFCDGMAGCVAQAVNPVFVAAVIAGHCAAC